MIFCMIVAFCFFVVWFVTLYKASFFPRDLNDLYFIYLMFRHWAVLIRIRIWEEDLQQIYRK
jgi:hypothetical protein